MAWTEELYQKMGLSREQVEAISAKREDILQKKGGVVDYISRLQKIRREMRAKEEVFERELDNWRQEMHPTQTAQIILFGEENKYRKEFNMCSSFDCEECLRSEA